MLEKLAMYGNVPPACIKSKNSCKNYANQHMYICTHVGIELETSPCCLAFRVQEVSCRQQEFSLAENSMNYNFNLPGNSGMAVIGVINLSLIGF